MVDFIILGAQKAATSSLQASLRMHDDIYMPVGESTFFEEPEYTKQLWKTFGKTKEKVVLKGIKRPDYLCSDIALERIKDALPECKFIIVLREPVSRTISSYCYMVRHAHLPVLPLNEGLLNCIKAHQNNLASRAAEVIRYSLYGEYIEKWFDNYDRSHFLILSQNQVRDDLEGVLKKCYDHLNVERNEKDRVLISQGSSNVGLYDPKMLKLANFASKLKTRNLPNTSRRVKRNIIIRGVGYAISKLAELSANQFGQEREKLTPEVQDKLNSIYLEDSQKLKVLLGGSVVTW